MIDPVDKPAFAEMLTACCLNYGRDASIETLRMWWTQLADHDVAAVSRAFMAHIRSSSRMPTVFDILNLINASNPAMRRPGPDEAWAKMPRSENDSVVWTDEMAYAWGIANSLVNPNIVEKPDWVAARMAFKDAYTRAVESAIAQGRPVNWQIARGHTKDNLEDVLTEALRLGVITPEQARPHLAVLEHVRPANQKFLAGAKSDDGSINQSRLLKFAAIKANLESPNPTYDLDAIRAECEAKDRELDRGQQDRQDAA